MSEIEEAIVSKLMSESAITALIGQRLYPQVVPQDVTLPAIAYQRIDSNPVATRGAPVLARTQIQFTCEADDYTTAKAVGAVLRSVLAGWQDEESDPAVFAALLVNQSDGYSEQHLAPVDRIDLVFWHAI